MLLMAERFGSSRLFLCVLGIDRSAELDVESGLLFYLSSGKMFRISASWAEVRGLIQGRNALAVALAPHSHLPPVLRDARECGRCSMRDACMIFHKACRPRPALVPSFD